MREGQGELQGGAVDPLRPVALVGSVRESVVFQSYAGARTIDGVFRHPLRKHRADNGWFTELLRLDGPVVAGVPGGLTVRQVSVSRASPRRLNAFHLHPKVAQNELWTVIDGQLMVWMVDCRAGSATAGVRQRVILSAEEPSWLHIPAGVAHGYRAGEAGALLLYAMDQQFDPEDPNEGRLAWDHFGAELWEEDRG